MIQTTLRIGQTIHGYGFEFVVLEIDPAPRIKVTATPKRNLFKLDIGDELQFEYSDYWAKYPTGLTWIQPETYRVGTMTDYVGGWLLVEPLDKEPFVCHTVP